jgi:hypothetical protein
MKIKYFLVSIFVLLLIGCHPHHTRVRTRVVFKYGHNHHIHNCKHSYHSKRSVHNRKRAAHNRIKHGSKGHNRTTIITGRPPTRRSKPVIRKPRSNRGRPGSIGSRRPGSIGSRGRDNKPSKFTKGRGNSRGRGDKNKNSGQKGNRRR